MPLFSLTEWKKKLIQLYLIYENFNATITVKPQKILYYNHIHHATTSQTPQLPY